MQRIASSLCAVQISAAGSLAQSSLVSFKELGITPRDAISATSQTLDMLGIKPLEQNDIPVPEGLELKPPLGSLMVCYFGFYTGLDESYSVSDILNLWWLRNLYFVVRFFFFFFLGRFVRVRACNWSVSRAQFR